MSMMPFAKQAVSKARKSIYDSLELEEVVVDIEYYSSDNEEEQRQRERRSPSIEDSKFGILAAATTLTSLRESRPAYPPFNYPPQEQEGPRRKFNLAQLALPLKDNSIDPTDIFVKHEVLADPESTSPSVPVKLFDCRSMADIPGTSSAPQTTAATGPRRGAAAAKFVITNPPINLGALSSVPTDHSYLFSDHSFRAFQYETAAICRAAAAVRPKSVSTSASESSSPCEVSSTVVENNSSPDAHQNGTMYDEEVPHTSQEEAPCSSSSGLQNGTQQDAIVKCSKCPKTFSNHRGLQSHMKAHKRRFRLTSKPQDLMGFDEEYDDSMDKDYEQRPQVASTSALVTQTWTTEDVPSGSAVIKIEPPGEEAETPKMFACKQCYKRFSCLRGLKIHIKSHEKRSSCSGRRKPGSSAHNMEARSFDEQLSMDLMGPGDDDDENGADDLEGGAIVGNGSKPEGRMFLCTLCGKRFCRRNHLIFHLRIHSGERPYPCDVCPARFSRADSLKVHMRIHTGERPYVCDICGAAFAQMINANVHRRCHTGEKPFRCDECGARFIKKDGLTVHRRIHTGEKPYSCDQCGARFAYRSCILSHYKVHNGELLYRCEKCNAGFSLLCNLTRHKRVHAEEEASN